MAKKLAMAEVKRELSEIARVGQMFIDGDLCRKVLKPHSEKYMKGDDLDFDPDNFIPVKKTLIRLERLCRVPVSTTIWRRRPDMLDRGEALLHGAVRSIEADVKPANRGYEPAKLTKELKTAFLKGKPAWKLAKGVRSDLVRSHQVQPVKGFKGEAVLSLFVPVKDSMGENAAVLEVFASLNGA